MPSHRLRLLLVGVALFVGLIRVTIQIIHSTYYAFTAHLPEGSIMQSAQGQPFGEMAEVSSYTVVACIANGLAPQHGANPPYVDGNLIAIHIANTTQIIDERNAGASIPHEYTRTSRAVQQRVAADAASRRSRSGQFWRLE